MVNATKNGQKMLVRVRLPRGTAVYCDTCGAYQPPGSRLRLVAGKVICSGCAGK